MNTEEKIKLAKKLNSEGTTYKDIAKVLDCSESLAYAYVTKKHSFRNLEISRIRKTDKILYDKIYEFHRRGILRKLGGRVTRLSSGNSVKGLVEITFTPDNIASKYNNKCYLTGRDINLEDKSSYQLDHIKAASSGGESTLENCGLSCRQANWAKGDMSSEEFFQLCVDVVKHNKLM